ncbi:MAG: RtcB family protein [Candidatus Omnitrophica bacterium]|nr:RtcB family protein [Candidatus Omnitrophota bacterium]MDD5352852.1 RtcB family protein [Candidatus Omnitrophota bacterium]MDD5550451.1 RtcB family protein [Candidatus Omnitrophota bacterium]
MADLWQGPLERIDDVRWRIPKSYKPGMRTDGVIYADEKLLADIRHDKAAEQVANVAFLPGIVSNSLAMPDIHWGYGFPIGGVAATDIENNGVISPGGVGFDINCGVRLVRTNLLFSEIKNKIKDLVYVLFNDVPSGLGSKGDIKVSAREEKEILIKGARWAVEQGYGTQDDLTYCEEEGAISGAATDAVSDRAYERGKAQSGTLGSGNHFLEVQVVEEIYDKETANVFGVAEGQITVMIHSGSRGLGYQVCEDYVKKMIHCLSKYNINVPDRQLACAPVESEEGKEYLSAMRAAANYAWANRQCLMHLTRLAFERVFNKSWQNMGMSLVYDVAHNIAKIETCEVNGKKKKVCVHRKGATRALGPNHPALPEKYKNYGQPVIIPGDMGRNSYLLVGTEKAKETFYSTCHGAGRLKSRSAATRSFNAISLLEELESKGITVKASSRETLVEEAPAAYKNINDVVNVVERAGISRKVCKMRPLGVIKG